MARFLRKILTFFALTLLLAFAADGLYTFALSKGPANDKVSLIKENSGRKFGYIFLGSSRVNNSIVPSVIKKETGKTTLNLGVSSARPRDILLLLRLIESEKIKADTIFIQVDYGFNHEESTALLEPQCMPYLWDEALIREHIGYKNDAFALQYIPFYRYASYDFKWNLHAVYRKLAGLENDALEKSGGYMMLKGRKMLADYELPEKVIARNRFQDETIAFASAHKLNVVYFTAPFSPEVNSRNFMQKLKKRIPNLRDYSRLLTADSLFHNQSHLNHGGAMAFTRLLFQDKRANK